MKHPLLFAFTFIAMAFTPVDNGKNAEKIKIIDNYAALVDRNLDSFERKHAKCKDCFGIDGYFKTSATIVKIHNYQACLNIDYYYYRNKLVLVTIDGSFPIVCGCHRDSAVTRDYKARIYYDRKRILKVSESGSKPVGSIRARECFGGDGPIDFDKKAKIFLKRYGKIQRKHGYLH